MWSNEWKSIRNAAWSSGQPNPSVLKCGTYPVYTRRGSPARRAKDNLCQHRTEDYRVTNSDFCLFQYIYGMKQVAKCLFLVFCELLRKDHFLISCCRGIRSKGCSLCGLQAGPWHSRGSLFWSRHHFTGCTCGLIFLTRNRPGGTEGSAAGVFIKVGLLSLQRRQLFRTPHQLPGKVCLFWVLLEQSSWQLMGVSLLLGGKSSFSPSPTTPVWGAVNF